MKVYDEPLKWMTFDELAENHSFKWLLLLDVPEGDSLIGGYLKAEADYNEEELIDELNKQYKDNNASVLIISDLADRAMGVWPF